MPTPTHATCLLDIFQRYIREPYAGMMASLLMRATDARFVRVSAAHAARRMREEPVTSLSVLRRHVTFVCRHAA